MKILKDTETRGLGQGDRKINRDSESARSVLRAPAEQR